MGKRNDIICDVNVCRNGEIMRLVFVLTFIVPMTTFATLTTQRFGNQTYTSGYENGQYVNTTSQTFGNQTYTSGTVGGATVNTTSQTFGNQTYTSGNLGNDSVNVTSQTFGNQTYTSGTIGRSSVNATTQRFGNQEYTSGSVGGEQFNSTRQSIGGMSFGSASYTDNKRVSNSSVGVESVADIERETQSIKDEIARLKRELEIEKENARQESLRQEKLRKSEAAKKREQALMQKEQEEAVPQDEDMEEEQPIRLTDRKPSSKLLCSSVVSSAHVRTITLENGRSFRVSLRDQFFIGGWVGDTVDVYSNFDKRGRYTGTVLKNVNKNTSMKVD